MKKRILSLILTLCMLLGLLPAPALAADTDPVTITYTDGSTPAETWNGDGAMTIKKSCTVTVNQEYEQSGVLTVDPGSDQPITVTIEGDHHAITAGIGILFVFKAGAKVTVRNLNVTSTKTGNNNLIQIHGADVEFSNAYLTVADGDIFHMEGGGLTIKSGEYTVQSVTPSYAYAAYAICNDRGTIALEGGTIQTGGTMTLRNDGGAVTISGGTVKNTNTGWEGHALYNGVAEDKTPGTVTMTGGRLESSYASCVQNCTGCTLTISGGSIKGESEGINNTGTVNINGGWITCTRGTAVYSGTINMTDGKISAPTTSQKYCIKADGDVKLLGGKLLGGDYGFYLANNPKANLEISGSPVFSGNGNRDIYAEKPFTLKDYTGDPLSVSVGQIPVNEPKQVTTDGTAEDLKDKVTSTSNYYVGFDDAKQYIFFYQHQHTVADEWSIDEIGHWHKYSCTDDPYCTMTEDSQAGYDAHRYSDWMNDNEKHWKYCFLCKYRIDEGAHSLGDWQKDGSRHWKVCSVCGKQLNGGRHDYGDDKFNPVCNTCGYTRKVPYPTPVAGEGYKIDFFQETITVNSGYVVYTTPGDYTSKSYSTGDPVTPGDTLHICRSWDSNHNNSDWAELPIPQRPAAPAESDFTVTQPAFAGDKGSVASITAAMEYSTDGGGTWTAGDGGVLSDLPENAAVLIRVKATDSSFRSESYSVTLGAGAERTYTLTVTAPAFDPIFFGDPQPAAKPVIIQNIGNSDAAITKVEVSGADFTLNKYDGATVPAGSTDNATYTIRPKDGLIAGTYTATITVTYDHGAAPATASVSFTVKTPTCYTVAFNSQGGSNIESQSVREGGTAAKPADPARSGYAFGGWYTEAGCVHRWDFGNAVTGDLTLCAKWVKQTYSISGTVKQPDGNGIDNVKVRLMQGNTEIDSATTENGGSYSFSDVAPGSYNVVAEQMTGGVTKTVTILVEIAADHAANQDMVMPTGQVNSVLVVKSGGNVTTPDVVVGNLDEEAEAVKTAESAATSVTVTMTVESREESAAVHHEEIKAKAGIGRTLEYMDIKVEKKVNNASAVPITETSKRLEIVIPFDPSNKYDVTVYRYHAEEDGTGEAEALNSSASSDEYFKVGADSVTIYARKFSTYAIGYKTGAKPDGGGGTSGGSGGGSSGGGSGGSSYPPVIRQPEHGKISISPAQPEKDGKVTVTVKPDSGYTVETITVTDKNGKAVAVAKNADGTYTFTQPSGKVTISAALRAAQSGSGYASCPRGETCPIWPYTDASTTAWYHDGVHYCIEKGLMNGFTDGTFKPDAALSRAQLAQILYNREGRPAVFSGSPFTDVANNAWCASAVIWANQNGIVGGYGNGLFGSNNPITREQLAAMLWRYAKAKGYDVSVGENTNILSYKDFSRIHEYAVPPLQWAVGAGVMQGKGGGILDPVGRATRAQAAAMLQRYLENAAH